MYFVYVFMLLLLTVSYLDMQMTPPLRQKVKGTKKPLWLHPLYCHSHLLPSVSLEPPPMDETALGKARN